MRRERKREREREREKRRERERRERAHKQRALCCFDDVSLVTHGLSAERGLEEITKPGMLI